MERTDSYKEQVKDRFRINLHNAMLETGETVRRLHIYTGLTTQNIYGILNGKQIPTLPTALALAEAVGKTVDELVED